MAHITAPSPARKSDSFAPPGGRPIEDQSPAATPKQPATPTDAPAVPCELLPTAVEPLSTLSREIRQCHNKFNDELLGGLRRGWHYAVQAGDLLHAAKRIFIKLPPKTRQPKKWEDWIEQNCGFSSRTAQVYQQIAKNKSTLERELKKPQNSAVLSIAGALKLLAGPKPQTDPKQDNKPHKALAKVGKDAVEKHPSPTDPNDVENPLPNAGDNGDDADGAGGSSHEKKNVVKGGKSKLAPPPHKSAGDGDTGNADHGHDTPEANTDPQQPFAPDPNDGTGATTATNRKRLQDLLVLLQRADAILKDASDIIKGMSSEIIDRPQYGTIVRDISRAAEFLAGCLAADPLQKPLEPLPRDKESAGAEVKKPNSESIFVVPVDGKPFEVTERAGMWHFRQPDQNDWVCCSSEFVAIIEKHLGLPNDNSPLDADHKLEKGESK